MAAPSLILIFALAIYPLLYTIFISFTELNMMTSETQYKGAANYIQAFTSGRILEFHLGHFTFYHSVFSDPGAFRAYWSPCCSTRNLKEDGCSAQLYWFHGRCLPW